MFVRKSTQKSRKRYFSTENICFSRRKLSFFKHSHISFTKTGTQYETPAASQAGTMAAHTIMERYQNKAINESIRYAEYKDVNDYLIGRKSIIPHKEDV